MARTARASRRSQPSPVSTGSGKARSPSKVSASTARSGGDQAWHRHGPQGRRVFPYMSVRDNSMMGAFSRSDAVRPRVVRRRVDPVSAPEGSVALVAAGTMSGGEQQMLVIGRALMVEAPSARRVARRRAEDRAGHRPLDRGHQQGRVERPARRTEFTHGVARIASRYDDGSARLGRPPTSSTSASSISISAAIFKGRDAHPRRQPQHHRLDDRKDRRRGERPRQPRPASKFARSIPTLVREYRRLFRRRPFPCLACWPEVAKERTPTLSSSPCFRTTLGSRRRVARRSASSSGSARRRSYGYGEPCRGGVQQSSLPLARSIAPIERQSRQITGLPGGAGACARRTCRCSRSKSRARAACRHD